MGVRSGDLERLREVGYEAYVEAQLAYETLPDPHIDAFMAKSRVLLADQCELRRAANVAYGRLDGF